MSQPTTLHGVERRIAKAKWDTKADIENIFAKLRDDGYIVTELEGFGDDILHYEITTGDRHNTITCRFRHLIASDIWLVDKFEYSNGVEK